MKKLSPLMLVHFVLMAILLILSIVSAVMLIAGVGFKFGALQAGDKASIILFGIFNAINAVALCFNIVYLLRGYTKQAAFYYKAALFTRIVATAVCIAMMAFNFQVQTAKTALVVAIIVLLAAKAAVMAYMTFKKNIGKKNTWILFHVLTAVDVAIGILFLFSQDVNLMHTIINFASRIALDGSIGLSVRGKYKDKDSRGTK